ncbi:MAG: hypothetical protein Q8Q00_01975 [Dehalococcoidia bacterium]|nr:hypothetical protein [Dehalococcoidia bacterium]
MVVALDTLEHVPDEERPAFMHERAAARFRALRHSERPHIPPGDRAGGAATGPLPAARPVLGEPFSAGTPRARPPQDRGHRTCPKRAADTRPQSRQERDTACVS